MARIAFHAPMKPPTHPNPSGDREMARNLMRLLAGRGDRVELVSELRTWEGAGDPARQADLRAQAELEVARIIDEAAAEPIDLWVTYHNYYKAPDLIGPTVTRALSIPYVQIESTRAKKRLSGPWAGFAQAAEAAADAARVIFHLTRRDAETLERDRAPGQRLAYLPPFLPIETLPPAAAQAADAPMLAVGMMREGDKLASYRIIAETLAELGARDWRLEIAGDGRARAAVERLMAPFGDRVRFLGLLDRDGLAAAYARAGLLFWPGVNEAFGMVYLEAQAAGLPVVAQDRPGMCDVLAPGEYPLPAAGPGALAARLAAWLDDPAARAAAGRAARDWIAARHLFGAARARFWAELGPLPGAAA